MRAALAAAVAALAVAGGAQAQQVGPSKIAVVSFSDQFLFRVDVRNPYPEAKVFRMFALDDDTKQPVHVWTALPEVRLDPGAQRRLVFTAPFEGQSVRRLLICAEAEIQTADQARSVAQVCSRVSGQRL